MTDTHGAYRPLDPEARAAQNATLLAMEVSSLAGAAPSPATLIRLIRLAFRTTRLLRRPERQEAR